MDMAGRRMDGAMTRPRIEVPEAALAALCRRWKIGELAVFGSALRDDFAPDSDVDMLVSFAPDAEWSLLDHAQMQDELSELLGRSVDLVSRRGIEGSRNYIRRKAILGSAEVIYEAA